MTADNVRGQGSERREPLQLGLALSGGGFRATVFHLGVLDRLAAAGLLEDIRFVSTVSGGSLCIGLVLTVTGYSWPSSLEFRELVLPRTRQVLTQTDLQANFILRALLTPGALFRSRANDLAALMRTQWGIDATLRDLPSRPRWIINATCYETGKNWRFEKKRMGDYVFGYALQPDLALVNALAASAAYPGLIGPLSLDTRRWGWVRYTSSTETVPVSPQFHRVFLWDGGLYDNLGVEALFKPNGGYRSGVDFLIVSDASGRQQVQRYRLGRFDENLLRLVGIAMAQVRSLRARSFVDLLIRKELDGCYLQIGNTATDILQRAGRADSRPLTAPDSMLPDEVRAAANMGTHIHRLSALEFDLLYRHGYEVADTTLCAYHSERFAWLPLA